MPWDENADAGYALRFFGNGADDIDRIKIQIHDVTTDISGPPADIGATDFTIEFWMKAQASENGAPAVQCGRNINWIYGNIIFDRDRYNQGRKFGASIAGNHIVFGIRGAGTGTRYRRSGGRHLRLLLDGRPMGPGISGLLPQGLCGFCPMRRFLARHLPPSRHPARKPTHHLTIE